MKSLKDRTLELLDASEESDREIAQAIGMTSTWVSYLRKRYVKSPNVDAVQRLYEYLSGTVLFKD